MTTIYQNLLNCFKRLEITDIKLSDHLEFNLGMDSQEIISLISEIEQEFSINLEIKDIHRDMTVRAVLEFIFGKLFGRDSDYQDQFVESINIAVPVSQVYAALYDYKNWPLHLPNVKKVDTLHEEGNIQEFIMYIANLEGQNLMVNTVRKCDQNKICFFQTTPPAFLSRHSGIWLFESLTDQETKLSSVHRWIVSEAAAKTFSLEEKSAHTANEKVHDVLRGHARAVLATWKNKLEE